MSQSDDDRCLDCGEVHAVPHYQGLDKDGFANFRTDGIPDCRVIIYSETAVPCVWAPPHLALQPTLRVLPHTPRGCHKAIGMHARYHPGVPVSPDILAGAARSSGWNAYLHNENE
jgi:hypothetical protein